jgi:hypothetical protein
LIKTNAIGHLQWVKTYGGNGGDDGTDVKETADKGLILVGYGSSFNLLSLYLIKTDSDGSVEWSKTYGGIKQAVGYAIEVTTDKGFIVVGNTDSTDIGSGGMFILKTDSNGIIEWSKTYGQSKFNEANSIQQQKTRATLLQVGFTDLETETLLLVKIDSTGSITWTKIFGGSEDEVGYYVRQTHSGDYVAVGFTKSFGAGAMDVYFLKVNQNGDLLWSKTFGEENDDFGFGLELNPQSDSYWIIGYTDNFSSTTNGYFLKLTVMVHYYNLKSLILERLTNAIA